MEGGGAYGAGKATGQFDPVEYCKKPQVIARAISLVFAIVVFACISSEGRYDGRCVFNDDGNACNFGVVIGVFAFLGIIGFLIVDALFQNISNVQQRKFLVIADMAFCGIWTFLWFVCFCYLADTWRRSTVILSTHYPKSAPRAAIAFSFFSILSFGVSTYLAVQRYQQGVTEEFTSSSQGYDPSQQPPPGQQPMPSPYSPYPTGGGGTGDPYQQSPFASQDQRTTPAANFTPTY